MNMQQKKDSHVNEHRSLAGHEIDFVNVKILDHANTQKKLELNEILYIRKLKPALNKQLESELFTLIIISVQLINSNQQPVVLKGTIAIEPKQLQNIRQIFQDNKKARQLISFKTLHLFNFTYL